VIADERKATHVQSLADELAEIRTLIAEQLEERRSLAVVLKSMGEALDAMAENLQALNDALAGEEDEDQLSLDGSDAGRERDATGSLD